MPFRLFPGLSSGKSPLCSLWPQTINSNTNKQTSFSQTTGGPFSFFPGSCTILSSQVQLRETIRDVKTLHNENLVAVAQKKYVYIYDNQGAEVREAKVSNTNLTGDFNMDRMPRFPCFSCKDGSGCLSASS